MTIVATLAPTTPALAIPAPTGLAVHFTDFPGYGTYKDGYTYQVCSFGKKGARPCTSINDSFVVRSQGNGVSTSNLRKAANKASACLAQGEKAAVVAAAGVGAVAALASWIPGINEVTAAGVGVAAAGDGATSFVSCVLN